MNKGAVLKQTPLSINERKHLIPHKLKGTLFQGYRLGLSKNKLKEMKDLKEVPSRSMVHDRLNKWVKLHSDDVMFHFELDDTENTPELHLLDKAKFKLVGKPRINKKDKIWVLESQWISKELYEKYLPHFFRNKKGFTTEWGNTYRHATKFTTLQGAKNHFDSTQKGETPHNEWWSSTKGRNWRIRNIKTNEIYNYV